MQYATLPRGKFSTPSAPQLDSAQSIVTQSLGLHGPFEIMNASLSWPEKKQRVASTAGILSLVQSNKYSYLVPSHLTSPHIITTSLTSNTPPILHTPHKSQRKTATRTHPHIHPTGPYPLVLLVAPVQTTIRKRSTGHTATKPARDTEIRTPHRDVSVMSERSSCA